MPNRLMLYQATLTIRSHTTLSDACPIESSSWKHRPYLSNSANQIGYQLRYELMK